jgi:predicted AAA+ superfamily ATPase
MDPDQLEALLRPYNPWWEPASHWEEDLPKYHRPVVGEVLADLRDLPQMISITGPRRVGKSTAVKQLVSRLIREQRLDPHRVLYFSFDDPEVFGSPDLQRVIIDLLVERLTHGRERSYLFLDEVQRLPKWELYLKKQYDLGAPLRFIVSGSASSPIFRSSQESLLGRIKDRHLLPFSFREYCQYRLRTKPEFAQILGAHGRLRDPLLNDDGQGAAASVSKLDDALRPFSAEIREAVIDYSRDGGFPEVWALSDPVRKIEYLMEQQVRKVLYEDLMMLTQYRKPENVLRFFLFLLSRPGIEINATKVAQQAGVERRVVEDNLPRLEMTDLIIRIQRFSHQPLRVRQGNFKCYPVDMALRNAVLKHWTDHDQQTMGLLAENMVIRELLTWPEKIEITYFREKNREVDFVLTHGGNRHLPIEVKYRAEADQVEQLSLFVKRFGLKLGVVITRDQQVVMTDKILFLPLRYFLLAA